MLANISSPKRLTHKLSKFSPAIFTLIILLAAGIGCVRTVQPILKDDQVIVDKSVTGQWVAANGKDKIEIIAPAEGEKNYKTNYTDTDGKKGAFDIRLGKVQDIILAEIKPQEPSPDASDVYRAHFASFYSFLVVYQTTPTLIVSPMSQDWLKKYLDSHANELQTAALDKDNVIVTAPTEDIQKFILKHYKDEGAMGDKTTFVHPGDPTTRAAAPAQ